MSDLKLTSLQIQNFRGFRELTINQLGRVNLIVGKNNVGKTSLLEAIKLYVDSDRKLITNEILKARGLEGFDESRGIGQSRYRVSTTNARHLIHGRPDLTSVLPGDDISDFPSVRISSTPDGNRTVQIFLEATSNQYEVRLGVTLDDEGRHNESIREDLIPTVFLRSTLLFGQLDLAEIWQRVELTELEDEIASTLRIVAPNLRKVRVQTVPRNVSNGRLRGNGGKQNWRATAQLENRSEPEPLQSLGEGVNRMFAIALALTDADNGIFLVDEVESGLHHSIHEDVFRTIFEMAKRLNTQVFATTHSLDAVKAFERVANEHEEEGVLIKLKRQDNDVVAVTADEERVSRILSAEVDPR